VDWWEDQPISYVNKKAKWVSEENKMIEKQMKKEQR